MHPALLRPYGQLSYFIRPERLGPNFMPDVVWQLPNDRNEIFLTFDDGPHPEFTSQILDILRKHSVNATFFVVGENIASNEDLLQRMVAEGHVVGNHTYNHLGLRHLSLDELKLQVTKTSELVEQVCGVSMKLFRPPMGLIFPKQTKLLKDLGYQVVIGNVYPRDANGATESEIGERLEKDVRPGGIVILHDGVTTGWSKDRSATVAAIESFLKLSSSKYKFVAL